jgi:hypothetical protein
MPTPDDEARWVLLAQGHDRDALERLLRSAPSSLHQYLGQLGRLLLDCDADPNARASLRKRLAFNGSPAGRVIVSDQARTLHRVIPVHQLHPQPLRLRIRHQSIPGRKAIERIAPRLLVQMRSGDLD